MNSKRFYKVIDKHGMIVSEGYVLDSATKVNSAVVNCAAAVAACYGLDPETAVRAGKTPDCIGLSAIRKIKVKSGEAPFKAVVADR